ncbi:MAG: ribosomal protein S18-alanine N-acetyltransferase [FCB group bacterium]|nr:ribosomal protein S18-alanine N-acetyltransferase [FCB group bacterium]
MIRIRDMKEEDVPQIMKIEKACYDEPWDSVHFFFQLERKEPCNWVASENTDICAYINCCKWGDELHVNNIAVREDMRGRGIAQRLLDRAIAFAMEYRLEIIRLEVNENNQCARDFYHKNGFVETGRIPDYYENGSSNALILSKELETT